MKRLFLYTILAGLGTVGLSSCDSLLSVGGYGGGAGPVIVNSDYDNGYGLSYDQARQQALFLSDKMAYELGLTSAQYEAVYEINLDYFLNMRGENSLYGNYWTRRNSDLFYVLNASQYNYYLNENYFYRPVYWYDNSYAFRIYDRYNRDRYYRDRPSDYWSYQGGRNRQQNSYYKGRFGNQQQHPNITNRIDQRDWSPSQSSTWQTGRMPRQEQQQRSFGSQQRSTGFNRSSSQSVGNGSFGGQQTRIFGSNAAREAENRTFGSGSRGIDNRSFGSQSTAQSRGDQRREAMWQSQMQSARQSQADQQPRSFGNAESRFGGSRSVQQPSMSAQPQRSMPVTNDARPSSGGFGGHR